MAMWLMYCCILFMLSIPSSELKHPPKLLLISMDGFRWDYLQTIMTKNETPNFHRFMEEGVQGELINVFPTVTYPNHYTMITGLYPESHGLVHNRFYNPDPTVKDYFWYDDRRDNFDPVWYDNGAEPIYVTNKKANLLRESGSVLWPCGLGKVKEISPDRIVNDADPFTHTNFDKRVQYIVDWFTDKDSPINFGLLYFDEPDEIAHATGAGSQAVHDIIIELDKALGYLLNNLTEAKMLEEVNIILTADHGFTNVTDKIVLTNYNITTPQDYTSWSRDFVNHVTAGLNATNLPSLLEKLSVPELKDKVSVYVKGNSSYLRDTLHYVANERIAPVILTGKKEGTVFFRDEEQLKTFTLKGIHGQDPKKFRSMHPFFLAMGPSFKKGYSLPDAVRSVDLYPLMCHLLDITPAPNNGSLEEVQHMLVPKEDKKEIGYELTGISFLVLVGLSVTVAGIFSICACHNARRQRRFRRIVRSTERPSGVASLPTHHLLDSDADDDEF